MISQQQLHSYSSISSSNFGSSHEQQHQQYSTTLPKVPTTTAITTKTDVTALENSKSDDDHTTTNIKNSSSSNNNNSKHLQWRHPLIVCGIYYCIVISISFLLHDFVVMIMMTTTTSSSICGLVIDGLVTAVGDNDEPYENDMYSNSSNCTAFTTITTDIPTCLEPTTSTTTLTNPTTSFGMVIVGRWFISYAILILMWRLYCRKEIMSITTTTSTAATPITNGSSSTTATVINKDDNNTVLGAKSLVSSTTTTRTVTTTPMDPSEPVDGSSSSCISIVVTLPLPQHEQQQQQLRPPQYPYIVLYEYCWLCNVTLVIAGLALLDSGTTDRTAMIFAYLIIIGMDQLLWYVDLFCYILIGHCPIGVATYVFMKKPSPPPPPNDTSSLSSPTHHHHLLHTSNNNYANNKYQRQHQHWSNRVTWTHHLWTIPVLLRYGIVQQQQRQYQYRMVVSYVLSILYLLLNVTLSRYLIPFQIRIPSTAIPPRPPPNTASTTTFAIPIVTNNATNTATTAISTKGVSTDREKELLSSESTTYQNGDKNNEDDNTDDSHTKNPLSPCNSITGSNNKRNSICNIYEMYYLNINLSHEVYRDVQHIPFLRIGTTTTARQYIMAVLWRWQCFNTIVFLLLYYYDVKVVSIV